MNWERGALLVLAPAVVLLQQAVDRRLGAFRAQTQTLYLWSGERVKQLAPGLEDVLADVYWLRTVQYFGGQRAYAEGKNFSLLGPLVEITTTLDPRLSIAYEYGSVFLSESKPVGAGDPQAGIALLRKGAAALPGDWRLRQRIGFFQFLYLKDTKAAIATLNQASSMPGAPFWLRTLAAQLAAEGGERGASRAMWQAMAAEAGEGPIRENAKTNLQILLALDGRDYVQVLVAKFRAARGRAPAALDEITSLGGARIPHDPSGTPYDYDPSAGKVHIATKSPLYRPFYEAR